jgi:hypothetical protein
MDFGSSLNVLESIPVDWIIIGVFFLLVAADALRGGSSHAMAFCLSLPISLLIFQSITKTIALGALDAQMQLPLEQAVLFLIIEAVLFVCVNQMLFSFEHYTSLLSSSVAAFASTIVLLVVWIQIPVLQSIWHFGPQIQIIFGQSYRLFWLLASYLALAFIGG